MRYHLESLGTLIGGTACEHAHFGVLSERRRVWRAGAWAELPHTELKSTRTGIFHSMPMTDVGFRPTWRVE